MQLMIADPNRTFVVEFLGPYMLVIGFGEKDTAEALEKEFADVAATAKVRFVNDPVRKPIMTNWWHFFDTNTETVAFTNRQNHANGVERYRALDRYYDESATIGGMRDLMRRVKFSNVGTLVPGVDEFYPFTDNNVPPRPSWQDFANDRAILDWTRGFMEQYNKQVFEDQIRGGFTSNWVTAHSAVIDMKKRTLDITGWEEWDDPHRFYLVAPTMVTVTLPTGVQGFTYVVSNLTAGAEVKAKGEGEVGGATYELPIGEKIAIYAVPAAGYVVSGTNPYVIKKVMAGTTLEGVTLPTAVMPVAADTVVYGTIRTAEAGDPVVEAIAIKDGKYVYVGDTNGAAAFVEKGVTEVIDHRGKGMVMPGCTDGHAHYANTFAMGSMKGGILFDAGDGRNEVLRKLSEATLKARNAGKKSLCGFGWSYAILNDDRPTLQDLDNATHGVSTVILDSSGHHAFCNSECLRRCGIIDGKGNVLIREIDGGVLELKNGYPTGYVNERVTGYLTRMGGIDYDELIDVEVAEDAIRKTQEVLLSTGYTMTLDAWSNNLHPSNLYVVAKRLDDQHDLKLVYPMTYEVEPWQTDMTGEIDRLAAINETYGTSHVLPMYLKVFMDGVVETKTGATIKPYQKDGEDDFVYKSFWSADRLTEITTNCNAKGLTVHVHTMGDAAIKETVDAYVKANGLRRDNAYRNCLVHLRNVRKEDFRRIAENNIACVAGLTWHASDPGLEEYLSGILEEEYVKHAYPIRSFFDAGVKVSSHSDYAANGECPQDPFGMMQVAVTGMIPNPAQGDRPYDTSELISVEQAFQALTLNGAWQVGLEDERGSIKVGKWADFVLADQDVFACAATDIGKTKVVSTRFEGEKVYEAPPGSEAN
ncbi:MAG: amidohydrolase family protein, partial [bacterium]|nr:amidohydrolase family protein [Candidatus Colisoma equi]